MPIKLNGSTSGYVNLDVPAVAGTTNLTLPLYGFGKILQVVPGSTSTVQHNDTSTYADTGLEATITPSSTSSKIFILGLQNGVYKSNQNSQSGCYLALLRGSTSIHVFGEAVGYTGTAIENFSTAAICYLDSPATTSAVKYKTQFLNNATAARVSVQRNNSTSTIYLVEVGP